MLLFGQLTGGIFVGFYAAFTSMMAGKIPDRASTQQVVSLLIYALIIAGVLSLLFMGCPFDQNSVLGIKERFSHFCGFGEFQLYMWRSLIAGIVYFCHKAYCTIPDCRTFPEHLEILEPLFEHHFILTFLVVGIAASLVEEVGFRGIILQRMQGELPLVVVLLVQALLFGLYHFNIFQALYTFPLGILFGLVYLWTGSVWGSIAMHLSYNTMNIVIVQVLGRLPGDVTVTMILGALVVTACIIFFANKQPVHFRLWKGGTGQDRILRV